MQRHLRECARNRVTQKGKKGRTPSISPSVCVGVTPLQAPGQLGIVSNTGESLIRTCFQDVQVDYSILRLSRGAETYGEATLVLVHAILDFMMDDLAGKTFVDLGSGCGQVCLMMAVLSKAARYLLCDDVLFFHEN